MNTSLHSRQHFRYRRDISLCESSHFPRRSEVGDGDGGDAVDARDGGLDEPGGFPVNQQVVVVHVKLVGRAGDHHDDRAVFPHVEDYDRAELVALAAS